MTSPKLRAASERLAEGSTGHVKPPFWFEAVTTIRRSALQRIENGFGDLPDGNGRCAGNRNYCGATVGLDGAICPAGPIPDGVGPEKFAVYGHANSAAVFEKLNGTPVSQLAS